MRDPAWAEWWEVMMPDAAERAARHLLSEELGQTPEAIAAQLRYLGAVEVRLQRLWTLTKDLGPRDARERLDEVARLLGIPWRCEIGRAHV